MSSFIKFLDKVFTILGMIGLFIGVIGSVWGICYAIANHTPMSIVILILIALFLTQMGEDK